MYTASINGVDIVIESSPELFSPNSLDAGTAAMLSLVGEIDTPVLDLGCGCGVVGIYAAKIVDEENVVMCDISEGAVNISRKNAERNCVGNVRIYHSDGFRNFRETGFGLILSNPPYHADFSVPKHFIEESRNRLKPGGRLMMVTKRREWYENKIRSVFGGVRVVEREGYFVFIAEKRARKPRGKPSRRLSRKLGRKYGGGG